MAIPVSEDHPAKHGDAIALYQSAMRDLLDEVSTTQAAAIHQAADGLTKVILAGGVIHVFGTGHSHMLAEEVFTRAGGLAAINAVLVSSLMLHESALGSSDVEQLPGLGELIANQCGLRSGDGAIIISNAGINDVPVQFALEARQRGLFSVGITSVAYSQGLSSRHNTGRKLLEVVDVVLDNRAPAGDVALRLNGDDRWQVGAASTITGCMLINSTMVGIAERLHRDGVRDPPILVSSKLPGAEEHNRAITAKYRDRVAHL
ncbi:MAG TPA: SIS domain-containing protein [Chloroflexota bacterium]|nr:SIS domain-containing protein [Chloroflexota bacterium]